MRRCGRWIVGITATSSASGGDGAFFWLGRFRRLPTGVLQIIEHLTERLAGQGLLAVDAKRKIAGGDSDFLAGSPEEAGFDSYIVLGGELALRGRDHVPHEFGPYIHSAHASVRLIVVYAGSGRHAGY